MKSTRNQAGERLKQIMNSIRFGETKVLIQITRKASRKSDIDEIVFIQK